MEDLTSGQRALLFYAAVVFLIVAINFLDGFIH